jgi:RimJ/RimL family protein N-acetyltransferase
MNTHFVQHPTLLKGETVELIPLEEHHLPALEQLATDKRIWEFFMIDCSIPGQLRTMLDAVVEDKKYGKQYPFVIYHKATDRIIGNTRYMNIEGRHRRLEIGGTWLHPDHWATEVNFECKLLLLTHAFEQLNASCVFLKTDERNIRSRTAIQKIGAKYDGILRNEIIKPNGLPRNSAYYSIIDKEWSEVKPMLTQLYTAKKKALNR